MKKIIEVQKKINHLFDKFKIKIQIEEKIIVFYDTNNFIKLIYFLNDNYIRCYNELFVIFKNNEKIFKIILEQKIKRKIINIF